MKGKNTPLIIGTRGSELALWQANYTKTVLEKNGFQVELKIIQTKGDATQQWNLSFDKIEGKGFFTKELEDALLSGVIDLAVHSCKDLPTESPEGLTVAAYSKRANPFDLLIIRNESVDEKLPLKLKENTIVGTSSARRKSQILAFRPDVKLLDLRGNVPTRIKKLKEENYDAIVLASAGIERLNINTDLFTLLELSAPMFIPAPAQGVLAFQIRIDDEEMKKICLHLNDEDSAVIANVERQILHNFNGGCQMPLGVYAEKNQTTIDIWISQSQNWDVIPVRLHHSISLKQFNAANDFSDIKIISESMVQKVLKIQANSVFVTSDLNENDYLVQVLKSHNYSINYESYIEFSPVPFQLSPKVEWLFFSSKNGVKYFFQDNSSFSDSSSIKLAAINQGTANAILGFGYKADFIGSGGDLLKIASDFDACANGKIVFVQAQKSMQTIQKNIKMNTNVESLVVYSNSPKKIVQKRKEKILVFSSPLNAEAYFTVFKKEDNQMIVSIGETTTKKLVSLGVSDVVTAYDPTPWSLLDKIFSID